MVLVGACGVVELLADARQCTIVTRFGEVQGAGELRPGQWDESFEQPRFATATAREQTKGMCGSSR
jgi:hypothetical protein